MARPVGSKGKNTAALKLDLIQTLRAKGFDPAASLIEVHLDAKKEYKKRLRERRTAFGAVGLMQVAESSAAHLMEFIYAKCKAVELSGANGADLFTSYTDMIKRVAAESEKEE